MKHKFISDNDVIKVCKCGETILVWQTVCSKCNNINVTKVNK